MNATTHTLQGRFGSLRSRFVAMLVRLSRPSDWRRLARTSEVLDAVLATASDSIFFVDARGKVRDCNLVAEQMFGRDRSEMVGRGIALYLPSLAFSALRRRTKGLGHDSLSLEMPGRLETLATDSSGVAFHVSVAVRSLSVWGNRGCIVRIRDDSRREAERQKLRRITDQLAVAKKTLEQQNVFIEQQVAKHQCAEQSSETANDRTVDQLVALSGQLGEPLQRILHRANLGKQYVANRAYEELSECLRDIGSDGAALFILTSKLAELAKRDTC